jgi:DNA-directed RNA polymerase subunit N (RpoN/RPB10)
MRKDECYKVILRHPGAGHNILTLFCDDKLLNVAFATNAGEKNLLSPLNTRILKMLYRKFCLNEIVTALNWLTHACNWKEKKKVLDDWVLKKKLCCTRMEVSHIKKGPDRNPARF